MKPHHFSFGSALVLIFVVGGGSGCFENIRPVANPPATPARTYNSKNEKTKTPLICENQISWETTLDKWPEKSNTKKKPTLPILEVKCETVLSEIKIKIRSGKNWDDFLKYRSSDGHAFGTVPIHLYFDKDIEEKWGMAEAWENEPESEEKKEDEYYVRIEMGFQYIPEIGKEPINKVGNIKLDAVKNNIIGTIITYSLRGRNSKGEWARIPPPPKPGTASASYKNFTEWDSNTITIRIPFSILNLENGDVIIVHGRLERNPKDIRLRSKCLRLGY